MLVVEFSFQYEDTEEDVSPEEEIAARRFFERWQQLELTDVHSQFIRKEARLDILSRIDDPWSRSQLFTVRVWYEMMEADDWEVRMQARHILTGETRYFREWSLLAAYLVSKLDTVGDDSYAAPC